MIFVFLLISNVIVANFSVSKSHFSIKLVVVNSDNCCQLFIINSGFEQATHFTSIEKEQEFYNYRYHINIPFFLKIKKDICEDLFKMKLLDSSMTPFSFYKKLQLEKAEVVKVDYSNNVNFSLRKKNKCYELTSTKEEAIILPETEARVFREYVCDLNQFGVVIKITDKKVNFRVDGVYMQLLFLFFDLETSKNCCDCFCRAFFTDENYLEIKEMFILPFYEEENILLKEQYTNPKKLLQIVKKIKRSRVVELFK